MDIKLFAELAKIENALVEKHSCTEGLAWCGENRGTLKKTKVKLFQPFSTGQCTLTTLLTHILEQSRVYTPSSRVYRAL